MPLSALEAARDLLTRQVAGEPLTDRELGQLDVLHASMAGRVRLPPDPAEEPGRPAEGLPKLGLQFAAPRAGHETDSGHPVVCDNSAHGVTRLRGSRT